ncbi:nucleotidyl transferase AbiEii/AbiGii toxin family protein [Jiangella sp. DSM 45060]|uniref:nucleotidyl transferase AbiEii/AbiGii toxin family protein n=1 Tax=Jiangella sp. DSM 45060 TaxID=1798224 RepID=UPI000879E41B|nr:nucleotidyl transferase AbiEii/AbiGii toxin family protein [Jiangella sp. DSM 45060]SDT64278.1 Nucleotidyl transferase AbiEii toxin, Type IV TA system [Jiangella sp. DSM 45060]
MSDGEPYPSAAGVDAAIKDASRRAALADPSLSVNERVRLEYFRRFLSRVFSEGASSEWLLKGGTGMLARVPSGRATRDIDLYRHGLTLDQALADLRRLAGVDLGDHFRFVYAAHRASIGGEEQPYTEGCRVVFDVYVGAQKKSSLGVDLAIGAGLTAPVTTMEPASALRLPRLVSHEYRLYPVVDQIADKVCATMTIYGDRPSSREKDLVDLVVLAVTHDVDGTALGVAISAEARRRRMAALDRFVVPKEWGRVYSSLAKSVPYCAEYSTVDLAREVVTRFVGPAMSNAAGGRIWSHRELEWS